MNYLLLFFQFSKFSLLCFGGGYMLVPLIIREFVNEEHLISITQFANLLSIAQITPGPIGINTATFVGYIKEGFLGAFFATLGLVFPTLILASIAVRQLNKYKDSFFVIGILKGARIAALAMIFYAIAIFANLSLFTRQIDFHNIKKIFIMHHLYFPSNFAISIQEIFVFLLTVFLLSKKVLSTTKMILISAILGVFICTH